MNHHSIIDIIRIKLEFRINLFIYISKIKYLSNDETKRTCHARNDAL